jgi:hypothetical protein
VGRELRILDPDGIYHVTSRGNNRSLITFDGTDRAGLRGELAAAATKHKWEVFAWCLMPAVLYVVRNPVTAGLCEHAGLWPDSSYRATVGLEPAPRWLVVDQVLKLFGSTPESGRSEFTRLVGSGQLLVSDTGFEDSSAA